MKALKVIFGIIGWMIVGVLSITTALVLVVMTLDLTEHRSFLSKQVEKYTSWKVQNFGDIEMVWATSPTLRLKDLNLTQSDKGSPIESLKLGNFELRIGIWPLVFDNSIHIKKFRMSNTDLTLRASEIVEQVEEQAEQEQSLQDMLDGLPRIFLESVAIRDFKLHRQNSETKTTLVSLDRLTGGSNSSRSPVELKAEGDANKLPFKVTSALGSFEEFRDEALPYPVLVRGSVGAQQVSVDGSISVDDSDSRAFLFQVAASGNEIKDITRAFSIDDINIPAYDLKTKIGLKGNQLKISELRFTLGRSYLYGYTTLDFSNDKLSVEGDLNSSLIRWQDIEPLWRGDQIASQPELREDEKTEADNEPKGPVFSREPLDLAFLNLLNGEMALAVAEFEGGPVGRLLNGLKVKLTLENGQLVADSIDLASNVGKVTGMVGLQQNSDQVVTTQAALGISRLDLTRLIRPAVNQVEVVDEKAKDLLRGKLTGRVDLKTQGKSLHDLASQLNGKVGLGIEEGAITATVVEAAGLDVTETLVSWFADNPLTDIQCTLGMFTAKDGVVNVDTFLLATKDSNVVVDGFVDLGREYMDIKIQSHAKDFSFLAGQSPIEIKGPLNDIGVDVVSSELIVRTAASILSGLVNPALAIVPFLDLGMAKDSKCGQASQEIAAMKQKNRKDESSTH